MLSRITSFIVIIAIGWVLFFFGGWHVSLSKKADDVAKIYLMNLESKDNPEMEDLEYIVDMEDRPSGVMNTYSVLVKVGKSYVGFIRDTRFFDVSFINWAMLIISLLVFYLGFHVLFDTDQDEDDSKEATPIISPEN